MSMPEGSEWEVKVINRDHYVMNKTTEFKMASKADAEELLAILEDYEDKLYSAWEQSMGEDL